MKFIKTPFIVEFTEQGQLHISYRELEKIFGRPYFGPGEESNPPIDRALARVTCQWRVRYEDGTVALIYDDRQKTTNYAPYYWRVGGFTGRSLELVQETIKEYRELQKNK